jgi:hypothetical protein
VRNERLRDAYGKILGAADVYRRIVIQVELLDERSATCWQEAEQNLQRAFHANEQIEAAKNTARADPVGARVVELHDYLLANDVSGFIHSKQLRSAEGPMTASDENVKMLRERFNGHFTELNTAIDEHLSQFR